MSLSLKGKKALVTGGSRGIGRAIALRLASEGASVAVTYGYSDEAAKGVVKEVKSIGVDSICIKANAEHAGESSRAYIEAQEYFGSLDILVSNAGVNISKPLDYLEDEDFTKVFDINVRANFELIREASRQMKHGGKILIISATIANDYFAPGLGLYGGSKAAINGFVQGWSRDLGPKGITINALVPGPINTDMNPEESGLADQIKTMVPLERYGTSEEVASLANFLVGPEAGFITGALMIIDGGMSV